MAKTNWQDPKTSEMRSTHISGLMEAVGKVEDSIGMATVTETNIPLTEVFISSDDRYRIFQAPEGKRNWTAEQAPVIRRNGAVISSGFEIDYGGGAIILNVNDTVANTYTADVTYTVKEATSLKEQINSLDAEVNEHKAEDASEDDVHGLRRSAVVLGLDSDATSNGSIAIGSGAKALKSKCIAIGNDSVSDGSSALHGAVAIGSGAKTVGYVPTAIGRNAEAIGGYSVAIGVGAISENDNTGKLGDVGSQRTNKWIVPGTFTVEGTKNFEIPHPKPSKSETHRIRHGAVESPTAGDTLYRYKIKSTKENDIQIIALPDYFIHLNKNVQIFVTPQGHFGNGYGVLNRETEQLEIHCQFEGQYNVLVIGTRNDNHQSVQDWEIKGVEREIGESWTGETYVFSVDEIIEVEEIKEVV